MAYFNCIAILKYMFPFVSKTFEATGSTKRKPPSLFSRLLTLWFHVCYIVVAVAVVTWQFAILDWHNCGKVSDNVECEGLYLSRLL